jgi:hypothetical protein
VSHLNEVDQAEQEQPVQVNIPDEDEEMKKQ